MENVILEFSQSINFVPARNQTEITKYPKNVGECKESCASIAVVAAWGCSNLPSVMLSAGCTATVEILRRKCGRCCDSGDFLKNCLVPLLKVFRNPYDYELETSDEYP